MSSHYLNHCWYIVNWTLGNKIQWHFIWNSNVIRDPSLVKTVATDGLALLSALTKKVWITKLSMFFIKLFWLPTILHPDSKIHGAIMGPTWVLSAPGGPHVGPINLVIRVGMSHDQLNGSSVAQRVYNWSFDVVLCAQKRSGDLLIYKALSCSFLIMYHPERPY